MKNSSKITFLKYTLVWLVALSIGTYFRLYPLHSFVPQESSEKATIYVLTQLRAKVARQVKTIGSDLSETKKDILARELFNKLLKEDGEKIRETIHNVALDIEKGSSKPFTPYLLASDSFYYYNLTENILKTGKISEHVKGSKYLNPLMIAPLGFWEPLNLHPYIGAYIYKLLKLFNPSIELMQAVSYTPIIITALTLMAFLFTLYLLNVGPIASLTGSIFFLLAPIFIRRSTFGWYDNDPYSTLFPLLILGSIFFGLTKPASQRKIYFSAIIASLLTMMYSYFWQGWMLLFSIIFIAGMAIIAGNHFILKQRRETKQLSLFFGTFVLGSFLAIAVAFGPKEFFVLFKEGWIALNNFLFPQLSAWPDLYISVGELHNASLEKIISLTGGLFFFILALTGLLLSSLHAARAKEKDYLFKIIILAVFLGASIVITLGAERFAILCLIPLSIFFTLALQLIINAIKNFAKNKPSSARIISVIVSMIVLSTAYMPIMAIHKKIPTLLNPIYNDTWQRALTYIKDNTPKDSIINAWWSPGHFIKSTAHRRVTFDGATINFPQAYWLSNVFLTTDEVKAVGILRMLNNSANKAAEYLQEAQIKLSSIVALIMQIVRLDEFRARILLNSVLKNETPVNNILKLTHQKPAPSYVLIYNEFVDSNMQLNFIGKWNFKEIEEINADPNRLKKVPKRNSKGYIDFLWTLAGGPYKYSEPLSQISKVNDTLVFDENVSVNLKTYDCEVASTKFGKGTPYSLFYLYQGQVVEHKLPNPTLAYSVILYQEAGIYKTVLLDPRLAKSMLVRLYFFDAKGLNYFKLFHEEHDLTRRTVIKIFEVDWEKFETNLKKY